MAPQKEASAADVGGKSAMVLQKEATVANIGGEMMRLNTSVHRADDDAAQDQEDSPRPLRDPTAPRPAGSSLYGFYGNGLRRHDARSVCANADRESFQEQEEEPSKYRIGGQSLVPSEQEERVDASSGSKKT